MSNYIQIPVNPDNIYMNIAIIFKMLQKHCVLDDDQFTKINNTTKIMNFKKVGHIKEYFISHYNNIPFNMNDISVVFKQRHTDNGLRINYTFDLKNKQYDNYKILNKIFTKEKFEEYIKEKSLFTNSYTSPYTLTLKCNNYGLIINDVDDYIHKTILKLKFLEENIDMLEELIILHRLTVKRKDNTFQINNFYQLNCYIDKLVNIFYPSIETRKNLISDILLIRRVCKNIMVKTVPFTVTTISQLNNIKIDIAGITIFDENELNMFKYIDHPGLNFFIGMVDSFDIVNKIRAFLQKKLIKAL